MTMQCTEEGWIVELIDRRRKACRAFLNRYEENEDEVGNIEYVDTLGEFSFNRDVLLNLSGKDRVETALLFIKSLEYNSTV